MQGVIFVSVIGKLHEVSFYGLVSAIIALIMKKVSISALVNYGFHPQGFPVFFFCYLFWASVLFAPIAIIGAYESKYADNGEGLTFDSDFIFVIILSHIAEEIMGLIFTPFWFLRDLFTKEFDFWKVIDYLTYAILVIFIVISMILIW